MLPVHGGGKYLFGGTYLLIYYLGILLASTNIFTCGKQKRIIMLLVSGIAWFLWWRMMCNGMLSIDRYLVPYWGKGFNPPSMQGIIYALIILIFTYSFFTLLDEHKRAKSLIDIFSLIGQNTLYIFMYHLMVKDVILSLLPFIRKNIWAMRLCIFIPMIVLPVLIVLGVRKIRITLTKILIVKEDSV